jgi:hypothetical protein
MPEDVEIAVIRPNLEEHAIRAVPLVKNLFDNKVTILKPKPNGTFVRFPACVTLHLELHPFSAQCRSLTPSFRRCAPAAERGGSVRDRCQRYSRRGGSAAMNIAVEKPTYRE